MVIFNPTVGTKTITITEVEVNTSLVIVAPSSSGAGVAFPVSEQLTRTDTSEGINGETITVSYNGTPLGTTTTGTSPIPGMWNIGFITINNPGTYTLKAEFAGSTRGGLTLGATSATLRLGIEELPSWAIPIGVLVLSSALIAVSTMKKLF